LRTVSDCATPDGHIYVEVPFENERPLVDCADGCDRLDTLHEHVSFFTPFALAKTAASCGLNVTFLEHHGPTISMLASRAETGPTRVAAVQHQRGRFAPPKPLVSDAFVAACANLLDSVGPSLVALYGYGAFGRELAQRLTAYGHDNLTFVDSGAPMWNAPLVISRSDYVADPRPFTVLSAPSVEITLMRELSSILGDKTRLLDSAGVMSRPWAGSKTEAP
jgi:hypothetical protein